MSSSLKNLSGQFTMYQAAQRLSQIKDTIFATISKEAMRLGAVNLGQGFPDFDAPSFIKDEVKRALDNGLNQYAPSRGLSSLRQEIARTYKETYGIDWNFESEILITNGATEAIFSTLLSLVNPGDEVIVLEPFYDSYVASIELAGGKAVAVTLKAPDFNLNFESLENALSSKTKLLIFNNPHNPSGRVYTRSELAQLAEWIEQNNLRVLSDEVYEFLVYEGKPHIPLATLPGMRERVYSVSSAGKTFGATGWKVGWVCALPENLEAVHKVHQYNTFSVNTPMQVAVSAGLKQLDTYLPEFRQTYLEKRNQLFEVLEQLNFRPILPQGTYFILCPIDHLTTEKSFDYSFQLMQQKSVASIPCSPFYLKSDEGERFIRFCFAKSKALIEEGARRLA